MIFNSSNFLYNFYSIYFDTLFKNFNKLLDNKINYTPYIPNEKDKFQSTDASLIEDTQDEILEFISKSIDFYLNSLNINDNLNVAKFCKDEYIKNLKAENKNLSNLLNAQTQRLNLLQLSFDRVVNFYQNSLKEKNQQLENLININSVKKIKK